MPSGTEQAYHKSFSAQAGISPLYGVHQGHRDQIYILAEAEQGEKAWQLRDRA